MIKLLTKFKVKILTAIKNCSNLFFCSTNHNDRDFFFFLEILIIVVIILIFIWIYYVLFYKIFIIEFLIKILKCELFRRFFGDFIIFVQFFKKVQFVFFFLSLIVLFIIVFWHIILFIYNKYIMIPIWRLYMFRLYAYKRIPLHLSDLTMFFSNFRFKYFFMNSKRKQFWDLIKSEKRNHPKFFKYIVISICIDFFIGCLFGYAVMMEIPIENFFPIENYLPFVGFKRPDNVFVNKFLPVDFSFNYGTYAFFIRLVYLILCYRFIWIYEEHRFGREIINHETRIDPICWYLVLIILPIIILPVCEVVYDSIAFYINNNEFVGLHFFALVLMILIDIVESLVFLIIDLIIEYIKKKLKL